MKPFHARRTVERKIFISFCDNPRKKKRLLGKKNAPHCDRYDKSITECLFRIVSLLSGKLNGKWLDSALTFEDNN